MKTRTHGTPTDPAPVVVPTPRLKASPRILRTGVLVAVFGLLLWARFLLVTGHPRTAIAEPASAGSASVVPAPQGQVHAAADLSPRP